MNQSVFKRTRMGGRRVLLLTLVAMLVPAGFVAAADDGSSKPGYRVPPNAIAALIDAQVTPAVSVGPGGKAILIMHRPALAPISEVAVSGHPGARYPHRGDLPGTRGRASASTTKPASRAPLGETPGRP